jgi:hypothetical protein
MLDTVSTAGIKGWFNDAIDSVRLIALVSPT